MIKQVASFSAGAATFLAGLGGYWGLQPAPPNMEAIVSRYPMVSCDPSETHPVVNCEDATFVKMLNVCSDDAETWWPARKLVTIDGTPKEESRCFAEDKPSRLVMWWRAHGWY